MRTCGKCKRRKPDGAFAITWNRKLHKRVRASTCMACGDKNRERRKKWRSDSARHRLYGVHKDQWAEMKKKAKHKCEVCGAAELREKRGLVVDHCHDKGHVRGVLCHTCNTAIGLMKDSPAIMRAAAKYIERRKQA